MPLPAGTPVELVSLAEVRRHLGTAGAGVPAPTAQDDVQLQGFIDAATPVIEDLAGRVLPRPITEVITARSGTVVLTEHPVLEVLTVTLNGSPVTGWTLHGGSGLLVGAGLTGATVTYTAGRAAVPKNVRLAALELITYWWKQRRGGSPTFQPAGEAGLAAGGENNGGIAMWRIKQILGPDLRAPRVG